MKTNAVTKTIKKITKVLNRNNITNEDFDLKTNESEDYYWIDIYTINICFGTLVDLENNNIKIVTIWPEEHEFTYTKGEKIPCIKTSIAIKK